MERKQIIRTIMQTFLVMVTVFIIFEFYQYSAIPYIVKWIATIVLVVANCTFGHWCGLQNGLEIGNRHNKKMDELRKQSFDKIVDMVLKEKTESKA